MRFLARLPVGAWAAIIFPLSMLTGYGASIFLERLLAYPSLAHLILSTAAGVAAFLLMGKGAEAIKNSRSGSQSSH